MSDAQATGVPPFDVVTVAWGASYISLFLDVCVPNQLTPGNIGALPSGSRYRIFTAPDDAAVLRESRALRQVQEVMPVDVVAVRQLASAGKNPFGRMTACHRQALVDSRAREAATIFLCADHLLGEGTFAAAVQHRRRGVRAVMCTGVRVERDGFLDALAARGGSVGAAPRTLVAAAVGHLHPFTVAHIVDAPATAYRPINVYWRVPGEGLLARCFNLHPLMLDPTRRDVLPEDTIDGHFVRRACPEREAVHVVTDSDELVMFEMTRERDAHIDTRRGGVSVWLASTMVGRCDSHQEWYWRQSIRLHAGELGRAWGPVEARAGRFAGRALLLAGARRWVKPRVFMRIARHDGLLGGPIRRAVGRGAKRMRRSTGLLVHGVVREARRLHKRATRAGRRVIRRVGVA